MIYVKIWRVLGIIFYVAWFASLIFPKIGDHTTFLIFAFISLSKADILELKENK